MAEASISAADPIVGDDKCSFSAICAKIQQSPACGRILQDWMRVSDALGVPAHVQESIRIGILNQTMDFYGGLKLILEDWRKRQGQNAKVSELHFVLLHCGLRDVADILRREFLPELNVSDAVIQETRQSESSSEIKILSPNSEETCEISEEITPEKNLDFSPDANNCTACLYEPIEIPIRKVRKDLDEGEVFYNCEITSSNPEILVAMLVDLCDLLYSGFQNSVPETQEMVLRLIAKHEFDSRIQALLTEALYYTILKSAKSTKKGTNPPKIPKSVVTAVVHVAFNHLGNTLIMRNTCLILSQCKIPDDVAFVHNDLVTILISILRASIDPDVELEKGVVNNAIFTLQLLTDNSSEEQKSFASEQSCTELMLRLISDRVSRIEYDVVVRVAWVIINDLSKGSPEFVEPLLEDSGMQIYLSSIKMYSTRHDVLCNMVAILLNISKHHERRTKLMKSELIFALHDLLQNTTNNRVISTCFVEIFVNLLSDGEGAWLIYAPSRKEVRESITRSMLQMGIKNNVHGSPRTLRPLIEFLGTRHTKECQLYACWVLVKLVSWVAPTKYTAMLKREGGVVPLRNILLKNKGDQSEAAKSLRKYATIIVNKLDGKDDACTIV